MNDDSKKIMRGLERIASISDPDKLERFASTTPYEQLRKTALSRADHMRAGMREAERSEKCAKCGAPLVNVEYYSAFMGQKKVIGVENDDESNLKKRITSSTPYSNFHLHTAVFCPACAGRKVRRLHRTGIAMMIMGVLGIILSLIFLAEQAEGILVILPCALLIYIGYRITVKMVLYLSTGEGTITNGMLARSEVLHDFISERYVRMTPFKNIIRAEGTNVVVGRGFLRSDTSNNR